MRVIRDVNSFSQLEQGCIATIGKFDGVHLGHQLIIDQLKQKSDELQLPTLVILIEPHPEEFFAQSPDQCPPRLTELDEKLNLLTKYGVDYVFVLEFNQQTSELSAQAYIENILVDGLGVACFIVGNDFRFGHKRQGDFTLLKSQGERFGFEVLETTTYERNGQRISSTYVREKLAAAEFDLLKLILGRPYAIRGEVIKGRQLGAQLGFPTCNIPLHRRKIPLHGVYACTVEINNKDYAAAVNIGYRPTVEESGAALLEVHLLDFSGDLYGEILQVIFHHKVRDEMKFDGVDELKKQIGNDVKAVRELLETD